MKRTVALIACAVVVLVALLGVGYGVRRYLNSGSSNLTTRTLGPGGGGDSTTIAIYAPNQLSKVLEQVTTAFQQEHPGTTFQFTLGPSANLSQRIQSGQLPNVYIDTPGEIAPEATKARVKAAPVPFGYDMIQLVVPQGNPKQIGGLDAFGAGSAVNTGMCAEAEFCGAAAAYFLRGAGLNAAPKIVTNDVNQLTDGVRSGSIDAVLLPRTDIRSVITSITNVPIGTNRIDYQMLQLRGGGAADQFIQWVQESPSARGVLRSSGMLSYYDA